MTTYKLRDYEPWQKGIRSDDSELTRDIIAALEPAHIIYAHNGARFDIPWLRSIALKYGLDWREKKLIDPCAVAWRKYRIGRNSLSALADFLEVGEEKVHVPTDIWRKCLMDDDEEAWAFLQERCESDVRILNAVSGKITRDVGMINTWGSGR
jgi:DNA polymerase III epsilon subunit-like protein